MNGFLEYLFSSEGVCSQQTSHVSDIRLEHAHITALKIAGAYIMQNSMVVGGGDEREQERDMAILNKFKPGSIACMLK